MPKYTKKYTLIKNYAIILMEVKEMQKLVNDYINNKLLKVDNLPTELNGTMVDRLFAKKFRKYSIAPDVKTNVSEKLANIIEKQLPLTFVPSFGGYKHWWCPTYPTIDWAEIFNMKFILEYLSPIYNNYIRGGQQLSMKAKRLF